MSGQISDLSPIKKLSSLESNSLHSGLLQRACACGQHDGNGGECESCKKKRLGLQRAAVNPAAPDVAPPIVHEVLRGLGRPLDRDTRSFMESRFPKSPRRSHAPAVDKVKDGLQIGQPDDEYEREAEQSAAHTMGISTAETISASTTRPDFTSVRIHTGPQAHQSARAVGARAYTVGNQIVFADGQYNPQTASGQQLLAHELTHVVQQNGIGFPSVPALSRPLRLQRQLLDPLARLAAQRAAEWYAQPRNRQFAQDLVASVRESPNHAGEILFGEVWDAVREHWPQVLAVTLGLLAAEIVIGILAGVPEPTLLTKVVSVILQILVFAIIGISAVVELTNVYEHGRSWFSQARDANGDPTRITEASRSFLRMIRHIVLAILLIAGVRARIRAAGLPRGTGVSTSAGTAGAERTGSVPTGELPENVVPITRAPRVRPAAPPRAASGGPSAFDGSAARQLAPAEPAPAPEPVTTPSPAPAPVTAPTTAPASAPVTQGLTPGAAAAAGVSSALEEEEAQARAYPICWPIQLGPIEARHFANAGLPLNHFVRTRSPDRDYEQQQQAALVRRWLRQYRDPSFDAENYHVHHVIPLFLGGPDELMVNGLTLRARLHLRGHDILRYQPQMATPPAPLPPLDPDIYTHPPGTPYVLVGYKETRDEACG
jgi:hypothetical protein